jgi:hypothetical protein
VTHQRERPPDLSLYEHTFATIIGLALHQPFRAVLLEFLRESDYTTQSGRPNLAAFARELDGIQYETLRRVLAGRRQPSLRLVEEAARVLRLRPDVFSEYRLLLTQESISYTANGIEAAWSNYMQLGADDESAIPGPTEESIEAVRALLIDAASGSDRR